MEIIVMLFIGLVAIQLGIIAMEMLMVILFFFTNKK